MAAHSIAEQDEIIMLNYLKALFNSIRSTVLLTIAHDEFMEAQEVSFVNERIKIFEKELGKLANLNKSIVVLLKNGLKEFKRLLPTTGVHLIVRVFRDKIVIPLENAMIAIHTTKDGKNWVKTSFVILRD